MIAFVNGEFVPEERAYVSALDRGYLYGDGLFIAVRFFHNAAFRWQLHMQKLEQGAKALQILNPWRPEQLFEFTKQLLEKNGLSDALVRITLSRGVGVRGYSPKGAAKPTLTITTHTAPKLDPANPPAWRLITSLVIVPAGDLFTRIKTCNKIPQIMARIQADAAGVEEALLVNTNGRIAEGTSSNLFWVNDGKVCTPGLDEGALAGVTRAFVIEACGKLKIPCGEAAISAAELRAADGAFLSLSSWGVVEIRELDGKQMNRSPLTARIRAAYYEECGIG
jgi:aminodeoxychorismate lyase